jgi:uncharacterized membrane protein
MNKSEFLTELESRLELLPKKEVENYVEFYSEMIDDRVEEGKTEDEAIRDIGGIEEVIKQIAGEKSITKLVKQKVAPKRKIKPIEIILLILGFPLWFPLALTCLILVLVGYLLFWILVIVSYAVEIALVACAVTGLIGIFTGHGIGYLGLLFVGIGGSILFFKVCILATKFTVKLAKKIVLGIKLSLIGGGNKNYEEV